MWPLLLKQYFLQGNEVILSVFVVLLYDFFHVPRLYAVLALGLLGFVSYVAWSSLCPLFVHKLFKLFGIYSFLIGIKKP
jgi:hypothetical protein